MEVREPIYKRIEKDLRKEILNGNFKQGDMLPSELELCRRYGVTRMTVRQAINNLFVDGFVHRFKGRGTFVTFNKTEMDQNSKYPFFSFTREMIGGEAELVNFVMEFKIEDADEIVEKKLGLNEGEKVYYVERVRKANNLPLVSERLYLPVKLFPNLTKDAFLHSFHDYVQNELNFVIKNQLTSIEARSLAPSVAEVLHCMENEPALYMSSVAYRDDGVPFMYNRQYFLGTHFRFKHNFSK